MTAADDVVRYRCGCIMDTRRGGARCPKHGAFWTVTLPEFPARRPEPPALTPAEEEIVRLVCAGLTDREIATARGVSESTVHRHLENIGAKLPGKGARRTRIIDTYYEAGRLQLEPKTLEELRELVARLRALIDRL